MTNDPTASSSLRVSVAGGPSHVRTQFLPFEVRDARSGLVKRGVLGKPVDLDPGDYWVSATLPDGQVLATPSPVAVGTEHAAEAVLMPSSVSFTEPGAQADAAHPAAPSAGPGQLSSQVREKISDVDQSAPPWLKNAASTVVTTVFNWVGGKVPAFAQIAKRVDLEWLQEVLTAQLRHVSQFNSVQDIYSSLVNPSGPPARLVSIGWDVRSSGAVLKPVEQTTKVPVGPLTVFVDSAEGRFIEVDGGRDHLAVAMPCDGVNQTVAVCFHDTAGSDDRTLKVEFYLLDRDSNALFQYMERGNFHEASAVATAVANYVGPKTQDAPEPSNLARLLASYVLLRENKLDALDRITTELNSQWRRSPDVAAVRMEAFARHGKHAEAAKLCASAPSLGVPMFASGIAYLQQRTRQYLDAAMAGQPDPRNEATALVLAPAVVDQLNAALTTIAPVGAGLDSRTIVTAIRVAGPYTAG
ncbi:MAG TPA: hypothetical protein VFQ87_03850 [Bradyrhizobium sp.]|jgi:hypothetical protein|nr:hypothetical protein [Bradyrhizobium sp.]